MKIALLGYGTIKEIKDRVYINFGGNIKQLFHHSLLNENGWDRSIDQKKVSKKTFKILLDRIQSPETTTDNTLN